MECEERINDLLIIINKIIPLTFKLKTHTKRQLKPINKNSSLGEQIKYYRMLLDIRQIDLAFKLGVEVSTLKNIENREPKAVNLKLIKQILDELNIQDKVKINDDYISFLLDNPSVKIKEIRNSLGMNRQKFADLLGVYISSIKKWENGKTQISRKKYEKLKESIK